METMPLWKRLGGSLIDKLLIVLLFIIIGLIGGPYRFPGDFGTFIGGVLTTVPSQFPYTEEAMRFHGSNVSLIGIDFEICALFVFANTLYYLITEEFLKASIGKRIFGGIILSKSGANVKWYTYIIRVLYLDILIILFSYMRYIANFDYRIAIILFFVVLDLPVFFWKKSLIDFLSCTMYSKRDKKLMTSISINSKDLNKKSKIRIATIDGKSIPSTKYSNIKKGNAFILFFHSLYEKLCNFFDTRTTLLSVCTIITTIFFSFVLIFFSPLRNHNNEYFERIKGSDVYLIKIKYDSHRYYKSCTYNVQHNSLKHAESLPLPSKKVLYSIELNSAYQGLLNLTAYDISDYVSPFATANDYKQLLVEFQKKIAGYEYKVRNILYYKNPSWIKWYNGLYSIRCLDVIICTFQDNSGYYLSKIVYFSNQKAFVLEGDDSCINILDYITVLPLEKINYTIDITFLILFFFIISFSFLFLRILRKKYDVYRERNLQATRLLHYSLIMFAINATIIVISSAVIFAFYNIQQFDTPLLLYILDLITTVFTLFVFCPYLYAKSVQSNNLDFIIPNRLKVWLEKRLYDDKEKRTLEALYFYPMFVLIPLPLGICSLAYFITFGIIVYLILQIRRLICWIKNPDYEQSSASFNNKDFKDYYVILDISINATQEEIDKSFNSCIAKYNADSTNAMYDNEYFSNVREAYLILSSSKQLRPQYDKEYKKYKIDNNVNYQFHDKLLEEHILKIREKLSTVNGRKTKKHINVIILSFLLYFIIAFIVLCSVNIIRLPKWHGTDTYDEKVYKKYR